MTTCTWLTEYFDRAVPIIGAPMAGPAGGELAAAVSAAGGLGMIGVGPSHSTAWIAEQAEIAGAPPAVDSTSPEATRGRQFGIGLMAWALDRDDSQLSAALELEPALVSVSFGNVEPHVERLAAAGVPVTTQVGNVDEAIRAVRAGATFLVARGAEAGGHGRNDIATLPLLQAVLERVDVPVVAAGGIATARGLAAVLAAGAAGAWVGTALLTAYEAANTSAARARLITAGHGSTVYGRVFDVALGIEWPPEYGGRSLRNAFFDAWHGRLAELGRSEDAAAQLKAAQEVEDYDTAYLNAGQGVGFLTEQRSAAAVIAELADVEDAPRHPAPGR